MIELIMLLSGGSVYVFIELLWRGYSHWSMFLLGGVCFLLIDLLNEHYYKWSMPLFVQGIIGSAIITTFEFAVGYIINIKLGWSVWDYSNVPFNLMGQICATYAILWVFLSMLAVVIADYIRYFLKVGEKPKYKFM